MLLWPLLVMNLLLLRVVHLWLFFAPFFHAWRSNAGAGSVSSRAKVTILPLTVTVVQLIQGRGTLTAPRHVFMVLSPFFYPRTDL